MTRIILIVSGKGGVGKTTLTSNLSYALADLGEDVIAIDANLTTPNLGLHTGMQLTTHTLHDVLKGKVDISKAVYTHPYGFRIIPASMSINDLTGADPSRLSDVMMDLLGKADFILLDSSAGLGRETVSAIAAVDEVIVIVNPTIPSVVDALKTAELARKLNKDVIGIVVNRRGKSRHELSNERIESMIEAPIIAEIPEDENVAKSIAVKQSVVQYDSDSPAAVEIRRLAHRLSGQTFHYRRPLRLTLLGRLVNWMSR
jgi:septum site-determining protein MinD